MMFIKYFYSYYLSYDGFLIYQVGTDGCQREEIQSKRNHCNHDDDDHKQTIELFYFDF